MALGIPSTSSGALFILLKLSFQSTKPFFLVFATALIYIHVCMYVCIYLFECNGFHFNALALLLVGSTQQFIIFVTFLNSFLLSLVAQLQCDTYRNVIMWMFSTILAI